MKFIIYSDGGARGNPGPGGAGAVIYDKKMNLIKKTSRFLGSSTNNQAEYEALILGLEKAKSLSAKKVDCYLDSQLVVEQLNRRFKVKNPKLGKLFLKVWNLSQFFENINFYHIPREKNKEADSLVNEVIDRHLKT
ncbi:ribonuclease HI family protein [Patescibacteria group bacterium]|nr:ribonuclease HI family protein [Patescibacteria group bacterium]